MAQRGYRIYEPITRGVKDPSSDRLVKELVEGTDYLEADLDITYQELISDPTGSKVQEERYVQVFDDENSYISDIITVQNVMKPVQVTNLRSNVYTDTNKIVYLWDYVDGDTSATRFQIRELSDDSLVAEVPSGLASYEVETDYDSSRYEFDRYVVAINDSYDEVVESIPVNNIAYSPPQPAPNLQSLTASGTIITMTFDNISYEDVYYCKYSLDEGVTWNTAPLTVSESSPEATSITVTNEDFGFDLNIDDKVYIKIYGEGLGGISADSNTLSTSLIPQVPSDLIINRNASNGLDISFTDNSNVEKGFVIQKRINNGTWQNFKNLPINASNGSISFTDSITIQDGTLYEYKVWAFNDAGNTAEVINGIEFLSTPQITTTIDNNADTIIYTINESILDATGYNFYVTDLLTGIEEPIKNILSPSLLHSESFVGEINKSVYAVAYVETPYGTFESANSNTVTKKSSPKEIPSNLTVIKDANGLNLAWTDNSSVEDGYKIERKLNTEQSWTEIGEVTESYTFIDVVEYLDDTIYEYRVRAFNNVDSVEQYSDYSNIDGYIDSISTPLGLKSTVDNISNTVTYSWTTHMFSEGYRLYDSNDVLIEEIPNKYQNSATPISFTGEFRQDVYLVAYRNDYDNVDELTSIPSDSITTVSIPRVAVTNLTYEIDSIDDTKLNFSFVDNSIVEEQFEFIYKIGNEAEQTILINSTTSANTTDVYTQQIIRVDFEDIIVKVRPINNFGSEANYTELIIPSAPKHFQGAYKPNTDTVDLVFVDNSAYDTSFKIKFIYDGDNATETVLDFTSTATENDIYTALPIDLSLNTFIVAYVYAYNGTVESLPSEQILIDKNIYTQEVAPSDFTYLWTAEGEITFYWTNESDTATGYKLIYTVTPEGGVEGAEQIIDLPSQGIGLVGEEYTQSIVLNDRETIKAKIQSYNLVDVGQLSNSIIKKYYLIADTSPPSDFRREKIDGGMRLKWSAVNYVDAYEIHYLFDNVEQEIIITRDTSIDISIDYASVSEVETYLIVRFQGGKTSSPTDLISFSAIYKPQQLEGYIYNDINYQPEFLGYITNKELIKPDYEQIIYNDVSVYSQDDEKIGYSDFINLDTLLCQFDLQIDNKLEGLITNENATTKTDIGTYVYTDITEPYTLYTAYLDKNITTKYTVDTLNCTDIKFNIIPYASIKNENVQTKASTEAIIVNENLKTIYHDTMTIFDIAKVLVEPIHYEIYNHFKNKEIIVTDIRKITVSTIGDSIFAGHPAFYADQNNWGNPESQMQYWLAKILGDNYIVLNKGKGSNTTTHLIERFDADIVADEPDYVIIHGGTNDLAYVTMYYRQYGWSREQYSTELYNCLEVMQNNIIGMIEKSIQNNIVPIIGTLIPRTTTYRDNVKNANGEKLVDEQDMLLIYNEWIIKYCKEHAGVHYVDFYNAGKTNVPPTPLEQPPYGTGNLNPLYDGNTIFDEYGNIISQGIGVHPNVEGFKIMAEAVPLSIFRSLVSTIGIYMDKNCKVKSYLDDSDQYNPIYRINLLNVNRGRTKLTTRYLKNDGSQTLLYSVYPLKEKNVEVKFSINGSPFADSVSKKILPNQIHKLDIQLIIPRTGDDPEIELQLPMRSIK